IPASTAVSPSTISSAAQLPQLAAPAPKLGFFAKEFSGDAARADVPASLSPLNPSSFDSHQEAPRQEAPQRATGVLAKSGFGDIEAASPARNSTHFEPANSGVIVLSKPKPVYTEEARRLQIEGEVLLEVAFAASGELKILRVVRGL